jgi:hypothetical protein
MPAKKKIPEPEISKSRSVSISQNQEQQQQRSSQQRSKNTHFIGFPETTNVEIDAQRQLEAALIVCPLSTLGWFLMLFGYNFYLGHKWYDHLEYAIFPSLAFFTAFGLWHRYQKSGLRRNVDIVMTNSAILIQTYKVIVVCECETHRNFYLAAFGFGTCVYILGCLAPGFKTGVALHMSTHLVAYLCNVILFRCVSLEK